MAKLLMLLSLLVLVQVAVSRTAETVNSDKPVMLQLYYETLCQDSKRFVMNQLEPIFRILGPKYLMVEFIPYGHASTTALAGNAGYTFVCQNGPTECEGNMRQNCALKRISDNSKQVKFVYCIMSQKDPSAPNDKCITEAGLDVTEISECTKGTEGQKLLASMGEKTPAEFNYLQGHVPSIHINNKYDKTAELDLLPALCKEFGANGPAVCGGSSSSASSATVTQAIIFSILLSVFLV